MIPKIKNVLYTTDLSKNSAYAFRYALNTAQQHDAHIHILHVIEPIPSTASAIIRMYVKQENIKKKHQDWLEGIRKQIEERLKQFAEIELDSAQETMKRIAGIHVVHGDPAMEILNKVEELNCDVTIMGTHGKGMVKQTLLGSVSERVLRGSRKPIYVIPLPSEDTDITLQEI